LDILIKKYISVSVEDSMWLDSKFKKQLPAIFVDDQHCQHLAMRLITKAEGEIIEYS